MTLVLRRARLVGAAILACAAAALVPVDSARAATVSVMVSSSASRSPATTLSGTTQSGAIHVFTTPDSGVKRVSFWLDDPTRSGTPRQVENWAPFDFAGGSASAANPWDTRTVANGSHTITVEVLDSANVVTVTSATFTVSNSTTPPPPPTTSLHFSTAPSRASPQPLAGATVGGSIYVFVPSASGITRVAFWIDDAARSGPAFHVEGAAPWDLVGTAADGTAYAWSTRGVSNGSHVISADVTTSSGVSRLDAIFTVSNTGAPTTYSFSAIAPIPVGTTEAQSVVVNDKLYLFGGFDLQKACCTSTVRSYVYNPATNAWSAIAPMPGKGASHAGIDTDGTRYIYYAGGYVGDAAGTGQVYGTTAAYRYDTVTNTYSALPSLPAARSSGGLAYVGGKLYYFSGTNLARTVDAADVWMLDVAAGATSWVARAPMPNPRNHLGWSVIEGKIYVVGGQYLNNASTAQSQLDRYDPATNTWTTLRAMPTARSHVMDATFVLDGRLVVASGYTTSSYSAAVQAYSPATDTWESLTSLPQARASATARSVSGSRYLYCCGSGGTSSSNGWLATPVS